MGVSTEVYRIRIGNFNCSKIKSRQIKLSDPNRKIYAGKCKMGMSVILICSILLLHLMYQPSLNYRTRTVKKINNSEDIGREKILFYSWARSGLSINKFQKMINGNRRSVGYRLAVWNCGRGLIQEGFSTKFQEVKHFLQTKKPHCFGVIESDLFSHQSQTSRVKYTTAALKEILKVDGYKIEFPTSWEVHGQARLIYYVSTI